MGGCMSYFQDSSNKKKKDLCGICHKEVGIRYLECSNCQRYLHYDCTKVGNRDLDFCDICRKRGSLFRRVNLNLAHDKLNSL